MSKPFEMADVSYYVFDPEDGLDEHETADAAESAAEGILDSYRDQSGDGWAEEAGQVHWGKLIKLGHSRETCVDKDVPDGAGFDYYADYVLDRYVCPLEAAQAEAATLRVKLAESERYTLAIEDLQRLSRVRRHPHVAKVRCLISDDIETWCGWATDGVEEEPGEANARVDLLREIVALLAPEGGSDG